LPKHPYRDGAIFHGALASLLVLVAWLTGGGVGKAVLVGVFYFVVATAWTWWRFRQRERRESEQPPSRARGSAARGREHP
jgi:membrane protein implicated in regulation of membrane protease activity